MRLSGCIENLREVLANFQKAMMPFFFTLKQKPTYLMSSTLGFQSQHLKDGVTVNVAAKTQITGTLLTKSH